MVIENLYLIILISFFLCVLSQIFIFLKFRQLNTKLEAMTLLLKESDRQRDEVKRELQELRSGTIGVGKRVLQLEKKSAQQDAKLDEAKQQDPQAKLYSRAMKMVALGAGVDELIAECEIPKAEAELLIRLHSKS